MPDTPPTPESGVFTISAPLELDVPAPVDTLTAPPVPSVVDTAAVDDPAWTIMSPPVYLLPLPTLNITSPDLPSVADPVAYVILPLDPEVVVPVVNDIIPLTPDTPASNVFTIT